MVNEISRRGLLGLAGAGLAAAAIGGANAAWAADEYDTLRQRWWTLLVGSGFNPATEQYASRLSDLGASANQRWSAMAIAPTSLWPDLPLGSVSANITGSYRRLQLMARAYASPGTGLTGDAALAADIVAGLDHLYSKAYNETASNYGNWWDWQIGAPQRLLDVMVLAYDRLSNPGRYLAAVDHHVPDSSVAAYTGNSTGGNRVDLCRVLGVRGALGRSSAKLALARDALSPVFAYVTTGDGLYADGSFLQHTRVPYTGTYGAVLLDGLSRLLWWLTDSAWRVTDANRQNYFDAVERAYAPLIYNGLVMDGVSGRAISRGRSEDPLTDSSDDHVRGHGIIASVIRLAGSASAAESARWRAMAKGWLQRDYYGPVDRDKAILVPELALCLGLVNDTSITGSSEPSGHRLFPNMDRAVHRRPGWAFAISMCSARTTYYEYGNGENPRGWHTSAGMTYWWGSTYRNGQYSDDFWPTVDPYRLPGITASRKVLADFAGVAWGGSYPASTWVGGATDGSYAAVGQYVAGFDSTMRAKKSWFCLDDAVVCLGSGITGRDGATVESTIDNHNIGPSGTSTLTVDGVTKPTTLGWSETLTGARWIALGGLGGYVFPGGATVKAIREQRSGRWRDINVDGSTATTTRRYVTLWHDHGVDPSNATYAYILMPGATPSTTAARAADTGWLTILANDYNYQGIRVGGLTAVNFWAAGTVGPVTVDQAACVMIREGGGSATVCVSDPKRTATTIDLTWNRPVSAVSRRDASVTVLGTGASLRLRIAVGGTAGATHTATVTLG